MSPQAPQKGYTPGKLTWQAGKWTRIEDDFPIDNGDIPASYVSLPKDMPLLNIAPTFPPNLLSASAPRTQATKVKSFNLGKTHQVDDIYKVGPYQL